MRNRKNKQVCPVLWSTPKRSPHVLQQANPPASRIAPAWPRETHPEGPSDWASISTHSPARAAAQESCRATGRHFMLHGCSTLTFPPPQGLSADRLEWALGKRKEGCSEPSAVGAYITLPTQVGGSPAGGVSHQIHCLQCTGCMEKKINITLMILSKYIKTCEIETEMGGWCRGVNPFILSQHCW